MTGIETFVLYSTIAAVLGIAIGVLLPAFAMGRAISSALEALKNASPTPTTAIPYSSRVVISALMRWNVLKRPNSS